jgi:hypothetical protein
MLRVSPKTARKSRPFTSKASRSKTESKQIENPSKPQRNRVRGASFNLPLSRVLKESRNGAGFREHSGLPHYEVHTLAEDRWLIDSVFFDKGAAIEDAKLLLERSRAFDAVRVLQVEEQLDANGFDEWTIYAAARPRRRFGGGGRLRVATAADAATAPHPTAAPQPRTREQGRLPALLLVGSLALAGLLILFAHRPEQPKWVWVFDRPEAWQKHELRNPWTGAVSR